MTDHHHRRPPSLSLLTSSLPARPISTSPSTTHRQSQSPFRYVHFNNNSALDTDEKFVDETPLADFTDHKLRQSLPASLTPHQHSPRSQPGAHPPSSPFSHRSARPHSPPSRLAGRSSPSFLRQPSPLLIPTHTRTHSGSSYTRPRALRLANLLRPWLPVILYAMTSIGFFIAIAFWKTEVFTALDDLSRWLRRDEDFGHAVLFCLIFLTTFPPIPLYSTLITLSGYTFGPWTGAVISYLAALSGALTVFLISRSLLRDTISRWLASTHTIKRVVRAIEKRPKLLFLIRLAPYPYNVMNCLLAGSPILTLKTYTICTALSLFKVIIHTSLGASIHSFKDHHHHTVLPSKDGSTTADGANSAARVWTIVGIVLCVAIFIYLSIVARRAVDEELDDETGPDDEERIVFLSTDTEVNNNNSSSGRMTGVPMVESPFRSPQLVRPSD